MKVCKAAAADAGEAARCLAAAFAVDPLINYFFGGLGGGVAASAERFFSLLMRARIAMGAPVLLLREESRIGGVAMGYGCLRPDWPRPFASEWERFEAGEPELAQRFAAYDEITAAHQPREPHYYLGVLGVHPSQQGRGAGRELLDAFCELSVAEAGSTGVYLETASPASLRFYIRSGFTVRGEGELGSARLWCVFRPT